MKFAKKYTLVDSDQLEGMQRGGGGGGREGSLNASSDFNPLENADLRRAKEERTAMTENMRDPDKNIYDKLLDDASHRRRYLNSVRKAEEPERALVRSLTDASRYRRQRAVDEAEDEGLHQGAFERDISLSIEDRQALDMLKKLQSMTGAKYAPINPHNPRTSRTSLRDTVGETGARAVGRSSSNKKRGARVVSSSRTSHTKRTRARVQTR
jgi:hypothetical protein